MSVPHLFSLTHTWLMQGYWAIFATIFFLLCNFFCLSSRTWSWSFHWPRPHWHLPPYSAKTSESDAGAWARSKVNGNLKMKLNIICVIRMRIMYSLVIRAPSDPKEILKYKDQVRSHFSTCIFISTREFVVESLLLQAL